MTARSKYFCQIQACNVILIIAGLTAVGLAASQFSNFSLNNYRKIDLRLLNWIYVLSGLVGLYTLSCNHGIVVAKTVHCVSIVVAIYSTAFYCVTLSEIVYLHGASIDELASHQNQMQHDIRENFTAKLVICSLMILVPIIACLAALVAAALLDRLVVVSQPTWPQYSRDQNKKYRTNRIGLTTFAAIKLFLALCALTLAILLEYEHQMLSNQDPFVLIALDHIAALLAIVSAIVDLHSAVINRQPVANYKVAIGVSVIAAVWCLKLLDIEMYPYYYNDIQRWRGISAITRNGTQPLSINSNMADRTYFIVIIEGILVALFALLFGLNLLSAVQASKCIRYEYCNENSMIQKNFAFQSRCLGLLHFIWGLLLIALVVLGLVDVSWNVNYIGADLMWLAVLFFATGLLCITYSGSQLSTHFLLEFICFTCSLEKMCASINLTYQSATYPAFIHGPKDAFFGRLILHSIQLAILFLGSLTALFSLIIYGSALRQRYRRAIKHSTCMHIILLLGNMFYGIVLIGCHVVFTLGYWRFSESLVEIPYFQMGNGLLVFGISILQALSLCFPALLLSVIILNVIAGSIALFIVSYAISNTYFLAAMLFTVEEFRWIIEVALILTACATAACVTCSFCSAFAVVSFLYAVNQRPASSTSTIVLCEENNYGTLRTLVSPQLQTPPVRQMEEQSIYWSTDENPYYYQASKRYYDQPYRIDSGFYGYALVNPQIFESPYAGMDAESSGRVDSGRYFRNINSSAAQTRIGHIFN
ncbi:putative integral membrane protein [Acanthocheilonema viteae]